MEQDKKEVMKTTGEDGVTYKEPEELFEELKKELDFLPNDAAKAGLVNSFIYTLTM